MKIHNPEYAKAPFELTCVGLDGKQMPDMLPMRFDAKNVSKAIQCMQAKEWAALRKLAVTPYLMVIEEIPNVTQKQIEELMEAMQ